MVVVRSFFSGLYCDRLGNNWLISLVQFPLISTSLVLLFVVVAVAVVVVVVVVFGGGGGGGGG